MEDIDEVEDRSSVNRKTIEGNNAMTNENFHKTSYNKYIERKKNHVLKMKEELDNQELKPGMGNTWKKGVTMPEAFQFSCKNQFKKSFSIDFYNSTGQSFFHKNSDQDLKVFDHLQSRNF